VSRRGSAPGYPGGSRINRACFRTDLVRRAGRCVSGVHVGSPGAEVVDPSVAAVLEAGSLRLLLWPRRCTSPCLRAVRLATADRQAGPVIRYYGRDLGRAEGHARRWVASAPSGLPSGSRRRCRWRMTGRWRGRTGVPGASGGAARAGVPSHRSRTARRDPAGRGRSALAVGTGAGRRAAVQGRRDAGEVAGRAGAGGSLTSRLPCAPMWRLKRG
jgi:hypothetical protein